MASSPVLVTWVRTRRRPSLARERHQGHSILSGPFLTVSIAPVSVGATLGGSVPVPGESGHHCHPSRPEDAPDPSLL